MVLTRRKLITKVYEVSNLFHCVHRPHRRSPRLYIPQTNARAVFTGQRPNCRTLIVGRDMDIDTKERVAEIRRLNEQFRTTFRGGQILLTASVAALPGCYRIAR